VLAADRSRIDEAGWMRLRAYADRSDRINERCLLHVARWLERGVLRSVAAPSATTRRGRRARGLEVRAAGLDGMQVAP